MNIGRLIQARIPDIAAVYGGVRGRTMSSKHQRYAWPALVEAGVKTVIDLRAADKSDRLPKLCAEYGVHFFHYPVDNDWKTITSMVETFPEFCQFIDEGDFYIACSTGLHRTDTALLIYWMFYAADRGLAQPELHGYLRAKGITADTMMRIISSFYKVGSEKCGKVIIPGDAFKARKKMIADTWRGMSVIDSLCVFGRNQDNIYRYFSGEKHYGKLLTPDDYFRLFPVLENCWGKGKGFCVVKDALHLKSLLDGHSYIKNAVDESLRIIYREMTIKGVEAHEVFGSQILVERYFVHLLKALCEIYPDSLYIEVLGQVTFRERVINNVEILGRKSPEKADIFLLEICYKLITYNISHREFEQSLFYVLPTFFPAEWLEDDFYRTVNHYLESDCILPQMKKIVSVISSCTYAIPRTSWDVETTFSETDGLIISDTFVEFFCRLVRQLYFISQDPDYAIVLKENGWYDEFCRYGAYV